MPTHRGAGADLHGVCSHLNTLLQPQKTSLKPAEREVISGGTRSTLPSPTRGGSTRGRVTGAPGASCCPLLGRSTESGDGTARTRTAPSLPAPFPVSRSPCRNRAPRSPARGAAGSAPPAPRLRPRCQVPSGSNAWPPLSRIRPVCSPKPSCKQAKSSGGSDNGALCCGAAPSATGKKKKSNKKGK